MSNTHEPYVPFSQREGLAPIPAQLRLGEVSDKLRELIYYSIRQEITRNIDDQYNSSFSDTWERVAMDLWGRFLRRDPDTFENNAYRFTLFLKGLIHNAECGQLFDCIEFLVRHPGCSDRLRQELAGAFVEARAAYRIIDNQYIAAIGTEEQAAAFERAIADAQAKNAAGARRHLIDAGVALRKGKWADSVRESIHAVESVAVGLAPGSTELGPALTNIEQRGHLHGGLKAAFKTLYGYSSDEKGVRHALVFAQAEAKVDEADALFMLGACASFVSYLLARCATS
jgi:hypothetical protein